MSRQLLHLQLFLKICGINAESVKRSFDKECDSLEYFPMLNTIFHSNINAQSVTYKTFGDGLRVIAKDSSF